jgi:hypothetical protein
LARETARMIKVQTAAGEEAAAVVGEERLD